MELQKINCEKKKIAREWLKVYLASHECASPASEKLFQLQFLFDDFVQIVQPSFLVIRLGIFDFEFMQPLPMSCDGRAYWSLGIGRLWRLRNVRPHQLTSCADYVKFHLYNQSCRFKL